MLKYHIWGATLDNFQTEMLAKIRANMREKGTSWINEGEDVKQFLISKMQEYANAEKWVDVANIAFMLYDRKLCVVDGDSEK